MKPKAPVLGVLGLCWVGLCNPTQVEPPNFKASRTSVLGVLGLRTRTRARGIFLSAQRLYKKPMRGLKNPTNPTHSTHLLIRH